MNKMQCIKETLAQLQEIKEWGYYVNKERFKSFAKAKYPLSEWETDSLWNIWQYIENYDFYHLGDTKEELVKAAMNTAKGVYDSICRGAHVHWRDVELNTPKWKVYFRCGNDGKTQQLMVDFREKEHVIKYAALLQRDDVEISHRMDFYETVESYETDKNGKKIKVDIYDGDIIFCTDKGKYSFKDNSGVYLCIDGCYKQLIHTPGRGYLRRGEPDFDQDKDGKDYRYNYYVFCSYDKSFKVIGNIYVDNSVLQENKD